MTREELKDYLINEAEYDIDEVEEMSPWGLVNAWLVYNGIINYTDDIVEVVHAAYNYESED